MTICSRYHCPDSYYSVILILLLDDHFWKPPIWGLPNDTVLPSVGDWKGGELRFQYRGRIVLAMVFKV